MTECSYFRCDLTAGIMGRLLDVGYYANAIRRSLPHADPLALWGLGNNQVTQVVSEGHRLASIAFTGTQDVTSEGFRVTHLLAQVASALGFCTVAGNAYGIDMAMMLGTLSRSEYSHLFDHDAGREAGVRQIVVLSCGLNLRVPKYSYIETGIIRDDGLYLAFINDRTPLIRDLLSLRAGLIVDLADALIVTEAGNRGALDTVNRAIESWKPVLAIDWGKDDRAYCRTGCHVLRELASDRPDCDRLSVLIAPYLQYQTSIYDYSCAHPEFRHSEVPVDGSGNLDAYKSSRALSEHLLERVDTYKCRTGSPLIRLVDFRTVLLSDEEVLERREERALAAANHLKTLFPCTATARYSAL